jgi:hypothetical protein
LDNIPLVVIKSGKATLAAAYQVTGAQLAAYIENNAAQGEMTFDSMWRDQPSKVVDMCLFDGDFTTMTPGPPGHDNSAVRVLVVISDGVADLWSITQAKSALPTTDPLTIAQ